VSSGRDLAEFDPLPPIRVGVYVLGGVRWLVGGRLGLLMSVSSWPCFRGVYGHPMAF
jgi:hypothetical protein